MALGVYFTLLTFCALFVASFQQINKREPTCPDGWSLYQGTCYVYVPDDVTWDNAKAGCARRGAKLAEPKTQGKLDFVMQLVTLNDYFFWVGGREESEGWWVWSGSRKAFIASRKLLWAPGQPDDHWDDEHCLAIYTEGWYDHPCSWIREYLCEKPASA